jgi:hypothetical protein
MPRVLCNVMVSDWSVNFIGPDEKTRVGPWLLLDSHDEVRAILRWGNVTNEELAEHEINIRRWGVSSAVLNLTDRNSLHFSSAAEAGPGTVMSSG